MEINLSEVGNKSILLYAVIAYYHTIYSKFKLYF